MKKICLLLLSLVFSVALFAQDITLTFTGKTNSDGYVKLSKVVISNLTKDWEETIIYPDTTYTFKTDGISDFEKGQKLLFQNMPNPFDGETDVTIQMTETEKVYMNVFDVNGKMVLNHHQTLNPGNHTFHLHLANPQTYILTVKAKGRQASIKMLNLKSGGANRIEYVGADDNLKYTLKSVNNENPFDKGDDMQYVGYTNSFKEELQSEIVTRKLSESETISLTFTIPEPTVTTKDVTNVAYTSATFNGESVSIAPLAKRGFCYGLTRTPDIEKDNVIYAETTDNIFTADVTGLKDSTTYAVRAFVTTSDDKVFYGDVKAFTTAKIGDMVIYTTPATEIDFTSAVSGGVIADNGGSEVLTYGVCFGPMENPNILSSNVLDAVVKGDTFTVKINELYPETKYHVRAYAITAKDIYYGQDETFSTKDMELPTVTTGEVSSVSMQSAVCSGTLTYDGHAAITRLGICWSTEQNPDAKINSVALADAGATSFNLQMKDLKSATTYYVRAFAENEKGIAYGEQREFTTTSEPYASIVTDTVSNITRYSARCGGEVLDDAGFAVTARGICWSTKVNPTIEDSITVSGEGIGQFTAFLRNLTDTTTYYVRAFATNETGTAYGEQREFRTPGKMAPTVVNFQEPFNIKTRSAEAAALISYQYEDEIPFDQGFVVDTMPNVTLETGTRYWASLSNRSVLGEITDLQPGTTYYINAYAKNSVGVSYYEQERSFTTITCMEPKLKVEDPYSITITSASIKVQISKEDAGGVNMLDTLGYIISSVGDPLEDTTADTVVWSTLVPIKDSVGYTQNHLIANLKAGTTYYLRLFAVTECAKGYSPIDTFESVGIELASVEIDTIVDILSHEATCKTKILSVGNGIYNNKIGLCYGTKENPEVGHDGVIAVNEQYFSTSTLNHTFKLTGLEQGTTYYVRAYVKNEAGMNYSDQVSFMTQKLEMATVTTIPASGISQTTANTGGNISYDGGAAVTQRGVCYATHENPIIEEDSITNNGEGTGAFQAALEGLTPATTYYYRAYAVNSEGTAYGEELSFTTAEETSEFVCGKSSLKDIDGNTYPTVQYGSQCWMAQNLRVTKFADGKEMTYKVSTNSSDNDPFNNPKPKYYDPDKTNHAEVFGYMYNYAAILNGAEPSSAIPSGVQGPCPDGWHVPSVDEYTMMFDYVKANLCTRSCPNSVAQSLASNSYWYQGTGTNAPKECTPSYEQETTNNESGFNVFPLGVLTGSAANINGQGAYLATTNRTYKGSNPQNMYIAIHISFSTSGYPGTNNPNFYRQVPIRCVQD